MHTLLQLETLFCAVCKHLKLYLQMLYLQTECSNAAHRLPLCLCTFLSAPLGVPQSDLSPFQVRWMSPAAPAASSLLIPAFPVGAPPLSSSSFSSSCSAASPTSSSPVTITHNENQHRLLFTTITEHNAFLCLRYQNKTHRCIYTYNGNQKSNLFEYESQQSLITRYFQSEYKYSVSKIPKNVQ